MHRFFALLLILLLPFQNTLAAVMAIEMSTPSAPIQMQAGEACHHEMSGSADLVDIAAADHEMPTDGSPAQHGNCGICHFSCCSALPIGAAITPALSVTETFVFAPLAQPPAPPAARPERPKWGGLA